MKLKKYLSILILISIIVSIPLVFKRVTVEKSNKKVDFILDYYQVEDLAKQSGKPIEDWLEKFKKMGVSTVGINYETIQSMIKDGKDIDYEFIKDIVKKDSWRWEYPIELVNHIDSKENSDYKLLVRFGDSKDFEFASKGLEEKYKDKVHFFKGISNYFILIDTDMKDALTDGQGKLYNSEGDVVVNEENYKASSGIILPIGIDDEKVSTIDKLGLKVMPRLTNANKGWNSKEYFDSAINDFEKIENKSPYMVFAGREVFGNPKRIDDTIKFLKKNDLSVGIVETIVERSYIEQKGMEKLLDKIEYNVNKVYSVPDYIQKRYKYMDYEGAEEVGNVLFRAIIERNANLIYFRPFIDEENHYVEKLSDYENMFEDLSERLAKHDVEIGEAKPYEINYTKKILVAILSLGVVAAGIFVLRNLFDMKDESLFLLSIIGIIGLVGIIALLGRTGYMILAILTGIVFPSLAIVYYNSRLKKVFLYDDDISYKSSLIRGVIHFIITIGITLIGSLIISAIMSSTRNVLDIDYFKGVKIVQLIPFIVYLISYIGVFGFKEDKERGNDKFKSEDFYNLMNDTTKIFYFIALGILGIVGYIYIARTGHETSLEPSNIELMFRNFLERTFYARPRTKEFLIAFPALIMGVVFAKNKFKPGVFISGLAGVIGLTSILNTFSHFKTPFIVSLNRTGGSIILGIVLGAI
ncbi:MAG: DUF5693 family protein [Andreesenia angusta]|nr:DUF5693 family protein [Andreesenia angusta]